VGVLCQPAWSKALIPVQRKRQPKGFKRLVSEPGAAFLSTNPMPSSKEYDKHDYWKRISRELYLAYDRICAYSCHLIPSDTGFHCVEHFRPKKTYPHLAYKWSNYRLVCGKMNGRKSDFEDVLDPFTIENGLFILDFPSTVIKPAPALVGATKRKVEATIKRLKLNDDESCIDARQMWLGSYCEVAASQESIAYKILMDVAPFLASELNRQGLRGNQIIQRMASRIVSTARKS